MMPRPGAANGVVPKNGIGIAFWIDGRAGQRRHGEGRGAEHDRRRHQPARNGGGAKQRMRHRREDEEGDEQADAAIGDERAGQHHGENHAPLAERFGHEVGDRRDRAAVLHQLAEHGAEQKQRKELRQKPRGTAHEDLRPVAPAAARPPNSRGNQRGGRRKQQHAPAAKGEARRASASPTRMPSRPMPQHSVQQTHRDRRSSAGRYPSPCVVEKRARGAAALVAQHGDEIPFGIELRGGAEFGQHVAS